MGDALVGQVVDFLGRPYPLQHQPAASGSGNGGASSSSSSIQTHPEAEGEAGAAPAPIGTDAHLPLLNGQPDMDSREQINEALLTGVRVRGGALEIAVASLPVAGCLARPLPCVSPGSRLQC